MVLTMKHGVLDCLKRWQVDLKKLLGCPKITPAELRRSSGSWISPETEDSFMGESGEGSKPKNGRGGGVGKDP